VSSEIEDWSEEDEEVAGLRAEVARLQGLLDAISKEDDRALRLQHTEERLRELERRELITGALQAAIYALGVTKGSPEEIFAAASDALEVRGFRIVRWELDLGSREAVLRDVRMPGRTLASLEKAAGVKAAGYTADLDGVEAFLAAHETGEPVFVEDAVSLVRQIFIPGLRWLAGATVRLAQMRRVIIAPISDPGVARPQLFMVMSNSLELSDSPAVGALTRLMAAAVAQSRLVTELERHVEELRETQAQLLHAEKMKALGQLAGGIAHDFNNLLTAISGSAELIRADAGNAETADEEAGIILDTSMRAAALVRQLLVFARPTAGRPGIVDLNLMLADTQRLLQRMLGESFTLRTIPHREACLVRIDAEKFQQILMNFVINARDAMAGKGTIEIRTDVCERTHPENPAGSEPKPWVSLSVRDEGHGMDAELVERVFEPFFTTKPVGTGTGLGLAVAYRVVRGAGGWIEVESEVGKGATFTCFIPAAEGDVVSERVRGHDPGRDVAPARILVIEDEPDLARLLDRALSSRGHTIHVATTLAAARQALDEQSFDLVLSDVRLPDGSGLSLVDEYERLRIPFILSSGYLDSRSNEREIRERGFTFLRKPYTIEGLLRRVGEKLE
jgi:signal transduction histidine kinase